MKTLISFIVFFSVLIVLLIGSYSNLNYVKENAQQRWVSAGFEIVNYEGYQIGSLGYGTSYGGARVYYNLKRIPDNGILYNAALWRWGNELHIYNLRALDAIKPTN